MNSALRPVVAVLLVLLLPPRLFAAVESSPIPAELFGSALARVANLVQPPPGSTAMVFRARLEITRADQLPGNLPGRECQLAFQPPDRVQVAVMLDGQRMALGRDGQELWGYAAAKRWGVVGRPGEPRFLSAPDKRDDTRLAPITLPLPPAQLLIAPLLFAVTNHGLAEVGGDFCHALTATPKQEARTAFKLPPGRLQLWVRTNDFLPARLGWAQDGGWALEITLRDIQLTPGRPADRWGIPAAEGDKIEITAVTHLARAFQVLLQSSSQEIPSLGPATGRRTVVAAHGDGRLEDHDGTRVLFLRGSPEAMGEQHGTLLAREVRDVAGRILYGVGVGSSFGKGCWFFGEIEDAQRRVLPFVDPRYLREMDALAVASGLEREEIRLANFFPELFHCSGFALMGEATVDGRMYHGRILDYLRGVGLEQNAVVIVNRPETGHAWVNISYAGFVGSVTAMNEKHISIGEMGGRGEGDWDGKPMAQLVREVMEQAGTLEEAVEIMRRGPRTCEYYYVIADGKSRTAVGIAATPTRFEVVRPGQAHPELPTPINDTVLLSAGERYRELVRRVQAGYGRFDARRALDLMTRPVCMNSNIHSVLFDPVSLDFWVANADGQQPASHTRYTKYNLADLLQDASAPAVGGADGGQR